MKSTSSNTLEDTYLQVLVDSLPEISGRAGFFVQVDSDCKQLRFIPRLGEDISTSEERERFLAAVSKAWASAPSEDSPHKKVLEVAKRLLDEYGEAARSYLLKAEMPLLGSAFHQKVLSTNTYQPFETVNYPDLILPPHTERSEFLRQTVPVLVSEYLCGLSAVEAELASDLQVSVFWLPLRALNQIRGAAVWFSFRSAFEKEDFSQQIARPNLEKVYSTAVTDIFVASLLDAIGELGSLRQLDLLVQPLSHLYLCCAIEFWRADSLLAAYSRGSERCWVLDQGRMHAQKAAARVLRLRSSIAARLGFDTVRFWPSFETDMEESFTPPVFERLLNDKLEQTVLVADLAHQERRSVDAQRSLRALTHRLKNLWTRDLPLNASVEDIRKISYIEWLSAEGFRVLLGGKSQPVNWSSAECGGGSIGRILEQTLSLTDEQCPVKILDTPLNGRKVAPLLVCLLVELLRNAKRHALVGAHGVIELAIEAQVRHGVLHTGFRFRTRATGVNADHLQCRLKDGDLGGMATIRAAATRLSCPECDSGLQWKFCSPVEEPSFVSQYGPCTLSMPSRLLEGGHEGAVLELTVSADGLRVFEE